MKSLIEQTLQRDIDEIRLTVNKMGTLVEGALRASLHVLTEKDRQLAYSVILRDRYIDELEQELDQLCKEFLVRQQPAAGHLRFVYAVIKINNELERIGDYAESIAHHFLRLNSIDPKFDYDSIINIAHLSIPMLCNAIQAFSERDPSLAKATMAMEDNVDNIRWSITHEYSQSLQSETFSTDIFFSIMNIVNRFERVADRACNICEEVLYMCTGENIKHKGQEIFRVLFVDDRDSCRGQIAKGIGNALGLKRFKFYSAGIDPQTVDPRSIQFMAKKSIDISQQIPKYLNQILELEKYQIFVSLSKEAEKAFPSPPTKMISILWELEDPSRLKGSPEEIENAYEHTFAVLDSHIRELVEAIINDDFKK